MQLSQLFGCPASSDMLVSKSEFDWGGTSVKV